MKNKEKRITVSASAGYCYGVKNAIKTTLSALGEGGRVFTFGELIHNEQTNEELKSKGIGIMRAPSEAESGDNVVLRAHGVPPKIIAELEGRGARVFDATCPFVKKIHSIVEKAVIEGKQVVVLGKRGHPETEATLSRSGEDVILIEDEKNIVFPTRNAVLVTQTTFPEDKYEIITQIIENNAREGAILVELFNTICYTTTIRQDELRHSAAGYDAVLVVGSRMSANTGRLFDISKALNKNTFFIRNMDDVRSLYNNKFCSILITAGASTPPWLVEEVVSFMSETLNQNPEVEEVVASEAAATVEEQTVAESDTPAKTTEAAKPEKAEKKELTMADIVGSEKVAGYTVYREGRRYKCTVVNVTDDGIFVNIGGKKDGFIDKTEVSLDETYNPADFKDGDEFEAEIIDSKASPYIMLSKKRIDAKLKEDEEAEKALSQGEFKLIVTRVEKGGLSGKLGKYTVFVPASQIRIGFVKNLEEYLGKELRLRALPPKEDKAPEAVAEVEGEEEVAAAPEESMAAAEEAETRAPRKRPRSIVASQRVILEEERNAKEDSFWNSIQVNDIVEGKVKRFTPFGAFVSVRGFDCLAHISELSWNKITDPSKVLKIGATYDFVVLKMDRATNKISLGYKQLQKKPYEIAAEKYPVGTVIKGKVERIFPFGAFVSIEDEDGVDGLVHVSQISHNWIKDANEALTAGQEVEAKIIGFEESRITLSIKELLPEPEVVETAPEGEEGLDGEGKPAPKKNLSRFAKRESDAGERRGRGKREDRSNEPREWSSGSSNATIGDLLKGLDLDLTDDAEKEEK